MSQTERIARLNGWLAAPAGFGAEQAMRALEVSASTLKRDIAYLRDRLGVPIDYDRSTRRYRQDRTARRAGTQLELPGLYLSAEEVSALLTMQHLLGRIDSGGLLGPHIQPLMKRLTQLLGKGTEESTRAELMRRIRVQTVGARKVHLPHFQAVGAALLQRRRLLIDYHARGRDEVNEREVSPQRLIHYRDNWYLDAWCHWRQGLRSFAVDAMRSARALTARAVDIPDGELDEVLGAAYGIFSGKEVQWALLRFSRERSRWVAAEMWHRRQHGRWDAEGRWLLSVPYADPRELMMDILRHVPEVEVIGPEEVQEEVVRRLRAGLEGHGGG